MAIKARKNDFELFMMLNVFLFFISIVPSLWILQYLVNNDLVNIHTILIIGIFGCFGLIYPLALSVISSIILFCIYRLFKRLFPDFFCGLGYHNYTHCVDKAESRQRRYWMDGDPGYYLGGWHYMKEYRCKKTCKNCNKEEYHWH